MPKGCLGGLIILKGFFTIWVHEYVLFKYRYRIFADFLKALYVGYFTHHAKAGSLSNWFAMAYSAS